MAERAPTVYRMMRLAAILQRMGAGRLFDRASALWLVACGACLVGGVAVGLAIRVAENAVANPSDEATPAATRPAFGLPSLAPLVRSVRGGVVSIQSRQLPADDGESVLRTGAGILIEPRGHVLTALHLVDRAARVHVSVPSLGTVRARVVGRDPAADVAMLELEGDTAPLAELPVLELASEVRVSQGDWVISFGTPLGFNHTMSVGVVAFVGRHLNHDEYVLTTEHLQISAPSGNGSSGGPIVSMEGEVVGLTTRADQHGVDLTFAVPASALQRIVDAMLASEDGEVRRGWVGVEMSRSRRIEGGVRVRNVFAGGPADLAGLERGDVLVRFDGRAVGDVRTLHDFITWCPPGTVVALDVVRGKERLQLSMRVGRPRSPVVAGARALGPAGGGSGGGGPGGGVPMGQAEVGDERGG